MWDYDRIKEEAKARGVPVTDLIALSPSNDAFYAGKPADVTIARWFADLWEQFGYGNGVHLRRVHYQIISQDPPVKLPAGMKIKIGPDEYTDVYLNYDACWNFITQASKQARYLGMVEPSAFDDRRNPEAIINTELYPRDPWLGLSDNLWQTPTLPGFPELPEYQLSDYEGQQRYMLEIWCFPGETQVQTHEGPKPISEIQVGEMVLTHKGHYRPVLNTFKRPYKGDLISVQTRYSAHAVWMTPNHNVLTLRGKRSTGWATAKTLDWVRADELITGSEGGHYKGDYLALPRVVELLRPLPAIEPELQAFGRPDGRGGRVPPVIESVEIDSDVAWMLGVFLGDGYVKDRGIEFTLNAAEQGIAARLIDIGGRFGITPTTSTYGNTVKVRYNTIRLCAWFRAQFGGEGLGRSHTGAHNKRIPAWLIRAPAEIAEAFVQGLWDADGTEHSAGHRSIVTASANIAANLRLLLARLGHMSSVVFTSGHHYVLRWGAGSRWGKLTDTHVLLPIRELTTEPFDGDVYNIEVAEDNSYVTEFAVHNCEKSTMNDVMRPLCEEYGANLQTGLGEMSITATLNAVERVKQSGKPTRIFYVSDFDPAGQSMPVAVSRKIEYFVRQAADYLDIRLYPVVLTAAQVEQYDLPRTPIKETERRAGRFEDRFGSGAVELDALEALHPGTLADIMRGHLDDYYDHNLDDRVEEAREALRQEMEDRRAEALKPYTAQIDQLREQYQAIRERFQAEIAAHSSEQTALWRTIAQKMRENPPRLSDHTLPEADESAADWNAEPLYDSDRDYIDQITAYKEFQGKEAIAA